MQPDLGLWSSGGNCKKNKLSTASINIQREAGSQLSEADKLDEQDKEAPRRTCPGNAYHKCRGRFILHSLVSVSRDWVHRRMHRTRHAAPSLLLLFSLLWLLYMVHVFSPCPDSPNLGCTGELLSSV